MYDHIEKICNAALSELLGRRKLASLKPATLLAALVWPRSKHTFLGAGRPGHGSLDRTFSEL